jgi:hypothetical protein
MLGSSTSERAGESADTRREGEKAVGLLNLTPRRRERVVIVSERKRCVIMSERKR